MLASTTPVVFFAASMKRVASAVGEGAIAVAFVHQALRE